MLHAILQQLERQYPEATLVMAPSHARGVRPFGKLVKHGFYPKAWLWRYGVQWGDVATLLPRKFREMYGVVTDREVAVVLDAAGFSYSDQIGLGSSQELARSSARWKRRGTALILLPQAFGPFEKGEIRKKVVKWVNNADLIFARDRDSYAHLTDVVGEQDKIKLYPDFTNLVSGSLPRGYDSSNKKVALVPNYRMQEKTSQADGAAYLPFMVRCAKYLLERGAKPFVLVHESESDLRLAQSISSSVGGLPIVSETDPLHVKGILGECQATVGSRFHGLVSALSQSVPSLATGWSHKYARLFDDYGFPEGIVKVDESDERLKRKIDLIIDAGSSARIRSILERSSAQQRTRSEELWKLVFSQIERVNSKAP